MNGAYVCSGPDNTMPTACLPPEKRTPHLVSYRECEPVFLTRIDLKVLAELIEQAVFLPRRSRPNAKRVEVHRRGGQGRFKCGETACTCCSGRPASPESSGCVDTAWICTIDSMYSAQSKWWPSGHKRCQTTLRDARQNPSGPLIRGSAETQFL